MGTYVTPFTAVRMTRASSAQVPTAIVLITGQDEEGYLSGMRSSLQGIKVKQVDISKIDTVAELVLAGAQAGIKHFITTQESLLKKLLPSGHAQKTAKISNYAGSVIPYEVAGKKAEFLIIRPLKTLKTLSYGEFLMQVYCSKFLKPHNWRQESEFEFKIVSDEADIQVAHSVLATADLIAFDIETAPEPVLHITMVGYTGFWFRPDGSIDSFSYVMPMKEWHHVQWFRKLNALSAPKVMQNGKYDIAYCFMYGAPVTNYLFDTINAMHSWYCELPKDIGFSSSLLLRNSMYWKDLANSGDYIDACRYNALDTWTTGEAFISWLVTAPSWAKENYINEFPIVPACHMCEMTGIKRDMKFLHEANERGTKELERMLTSVRTMTGEANFNPSSPKQVVQLLKVLGEKETEKNKLSSNETALEPISYKHPLNERVLGTILDYRKQRKELSTYLPVGDDSKEFGPPSKERILFSLNPHGTDTGRLASKEHHFWCGLQVQNITSDSEPKQSLIADEGYELWEADLSQAEDRGVAFSSGDKSLLHIFESGVDSHSYKAAMFFGMEYADIYDIENNKVINKDLRQLGKRINHGANYNMGARVLVATMGIKKIREAQRLLKLPKDWSLEGIAKYLLLQYEKAFPDVKGPYYDHVVKQVVTSNKLVGATGFTRYCFGDPRKNKMDLNAYVAHVTQSLNAMNLNKAFLAVFQQLAFLPEFKLIAQIHDSILFQVKIGHEYLAEKVKELMTFPVVVTDCKGISREMIVPVDLKKLGRNWRGV
jgi:DNA polymerase I-like protein with 3'-5' exonuclease and polymerase domains